MKFKTKTPTYNQRLAQTLIQINRFTTDHGHTPNITELARYTGRPHACILKHVYKLEKLRVITTRSADVSASRRFISINVKSNHRRKIFQRGQRPYWILQEETDFSNYGITWL